LGVSRNNTLARQWYEKAAAAGDERANGALNKLASATQ
jgi:TPR repeat protein